MWLLAPPENTAATELERRLSEAEQRAVAFIEREERERLRMERYRQTAERLLSADAKHH